MHKCQRRWLFVINICYCFIFLFFILEFLEETPNYDSYSEFYKNNESIMKSIKKSEKNFKHYKNSSSLSYDILYLVLFWNSCVMIVIAWSEKKADKKCCCSCTCCCNKSKCCFSMTKNIYIYPLLGQVILYSICLSCKLVGLIFLKKAKLIEEISDDFTNSSLDFIYNADIGIIVILVFLIFIGVLYMIIEYNCWKKNRTEGMEGTNYYINIIQREIKLQKVQIVQGDQGVQIQGEQMVKTQVDIVVAEVPKLDSNRNIKSEKIEEFQVNEKPN